jgi:PKD repeat protein
LAQIGVSPLVGYVNAPFSFSAADSEDLDGTIVSYDWEFPSSSGTVERSGEVVQHSFAEVGEQTVLVRATDDGGATNVAAVTVRVVNRFPVGAISVSPGLGIRGVDEFTFDATGSVDPDDPDEPLTYEWDLGPGLGEARYQSGRIVRFTFPATTDKGQRQITLRVTDSLGGTDTLVRAVGLVDELPDPNGITIAPEPVLTVGRTPRVGSVGEGLPPLTVSFSRAAGAEVTAGDEWQLVRLTTAVEVARTSAPGFTHTFGPGDAGEYQIRVVSAGGEPVTDPVALRVNAAPTASFLQAPGVGDAPRAVDFDSSGSSDPDGSIVAWRWNFGFFDAWTSSTADPTQLFTEPGRYSVTLQVTDDDGAVGQVERVVEVTGPIAAPLPPTWAGDSIQFGAIPGAESYLVSVTCGGAPVDLGIAELPPTITPRLDLPEGACPSPAVAAATVQVRKLSVLSPRSASAARP